MVLNFFILMWSGFCVGLYIYVGGDKLENYRVFNIGKGLGFLFFYYLNYYFIGERGKMFIFGFFGYDFV